MKGPVSLPSPAMLGGTRAPLVGPHETGPREEGLVTGGAGDLPNWPLSSSHDPVSDLTPTISSEAARRGSHSTSESRKEGKRDPIARLAAPHVRPAEVDGVATSMVGTIPPRPVHSPVPPSAALPTSTPAHLHQMPSVMPEAHPRPPMVDPAAFARVSATMTGSRSPRLLEAAASTSPLDGGRRKSAGIDTIEQEQALFEQRLCDDNYGVAVRKINQYGKSNLRYVKCIILDDEPPNAGNHKGGSSRTGSTRSLSSRSASSWGRKPLLEDRPPWDKSQRALVWGKKKDIQISLDRFIAVRKGKTTERTRRNTSPSTRLLSLITDDPNHPALDIEAPTRLDREKFARAFARFLDVPLEGEDSNSAQSAEAHPDANADVGWPTSLSVPGHVLTEDHSLPVSRPEEELPVMEQQVTEQHAAASVPSDLTEEVAEDTHLQGEAVDPAPDQEDPQPQEEEVPAESANKLPANQPPVVLLESFPTSNHSSLPSSLEREQEAADRPTAAVGTSAMITDITPAVKEQAGEDHDDASAVSSLTGNGYDQDLVEELHQALNDLRAELEESRAEAARAVKVAEQAIQSAEKSNSAEWQNTVTHKAAEAAALAQRRSAEAMSKARLAEERLEGERRTAAFWRKQAEIAEDDAGKLLTRAAAAEVQRAAMQEQLESQRRLARAQLGLIEHRLSLTDHHHQDALEAALERNRVLQVELDALRRDSHIRRDYGDLSLEDGPVNSVRRKIGFGRRKRSMLSHGIDSKNLLASSSLMNTQMQMESREPLLGASDGPSSEQLVKLQAETALIRQQFEMLLRSTSDELERLPMEAKHWTSQIEDALETSQSEVAFLREKLAAESATRRKLQHEVQDLRGSVRVYCREMKKNNSSARSVVSLPSPTILVVDREETDQEDLEAVAQMSFEFDRVFDAQAVQQDIYTEIEEVVVGVLDGFNICVMAYGKSGSGKTYTVLGDVHYDVEKAEIKDYGVQLRAVQQLFAIADHRCDRYKDTFTFSLIEVFNDRLCDLLSGTKSGEQRGQITTVGSKTGMRRSNHKSFDDDTSSAQRAKLEIRSDVHGNTVVQGSTTVEVDSFEDFVEVWEECLVLRAQRLAELGMDIKNYEMSSHVIATLQVSSANIATGLCTIGKLQFVDFAGANLVARRGNAGGKATNEPTYSVLGSGADWKFTNRSLETLNEVVQSRSQFLRDVPYRNSTVTHLLRDSLEHDTKVLLVACVSGDPADLQETVSTLRFASRMRRVVVGKATKHTMSAP